MSFLRFAVGAHYGRFWNNLKTIGKEEGKSPVLMLCDSVLCTAVLGSGLSDYLNYEYYKKPFSERKKFATIRDQEKFYAKVSPAAYKNLFSVKTNFLKTFGKYLGRPYFIPADGTAEDLAAFLAQCPVFIEKPTDGLGGAEVEKRKAADIADPAAYLEELAKNGKFLEGYIVQHEKMSALCPTSVNTARVMTSTASGTPKIIYCCLRVGNGSHVDNFSSGGMVVSVDFDTGTVRGSAQDKDRIRYDVHPITGIKFDGYQLPYWPEIRAMVLEAAMVEPRIMVIGWDVAITPDGPILVEGNRRPGFGLLQVTAQKGLKHILTDTLAELEEREKREGKNNS